MPKHPVKVRSARGKLPDGSNPKLPPNPTPAVGSSKRRSAAKTAAGPGNPGIVTGALDEPVS